MPRQWICADAKSLRDARQQILRMQRLVEQREVMSILAGRGQQIGRRSLTGKQDDLAIGKDSPDW